MEWHHVELPKRAIPALNRARFVYAPPRFEELNPHLLWEVQPPHSDAPGWQCSVYYYWYEYLRRHEGYEETCRNDGDGPYAAQFVAFGNVHALTFAEWWAERFWLFEERRPVQRLKQAPALDPNGFPVDRDMLYLAIDLTAPPSQLLRELRAEVWVQRMAAEERAQRSAKQRAARRSEPVPRVSIDTRKSTAHYPVATKPVLASLHEHLLVWDVKQANPAMLDADIADAAGIRINQVVDGETLASRKMLKLPTEKIAKTIYRRKQLAVQRHLRIAKQYIDNVVLGEFPKRDRR